MNRRTDSNLIAQYLLLQIVYYLLREMVFLIFVVILKILLLEVYLIEEPTFKFTFVI